MSSRNERSRKRKADEISDDEEPELPHLPASCLGAVLNFLPYSDVRKCMLAGRAMAVGAARHVDVLSIDKAAGMDVPALRRFPSVTVLKVVCLVEFVEESDMYKVNAAVAAKVVPLVISLPQLRKVWLGGHGSFVPVRDHYRGHQDGGLFMYRHWDHNEGELLSDAESDVVFRGLVEALGAVYESRAISHDLKIEGISLVSQVHCEDGGRDEAGAPIETEDQQNNEEKQLCRTCSRFCRNFPFENVLELPCWEYLSDWDWNLCVDRERVCKIIKSRPGGNDAIKSKRAGLLVLDWISSEFVDTWKKEHYPNQTEKVTIFEIYDGVHEILEDMLSWGYCLSEVTYSDVVRFLPSLSKPKEIRIWEKGLGLGQKKTLKNVWASQEQIELLVKLGLPIDADWYEYSSLEYILG